MAELFSPDDLQRIVESVFKVEDVTLGQSDSNYLVRYRGKLYSEDSERIYDLLSGELKRFDFTPLFRVEEDHRQAIILVKSPLKAKPANPRVNLILFIITVLSVLFAGTVYGMGNAKTQDFATYLHAFLNSGIPFSISMIAILGAHEWGHYFVGKAHGVMVTLPYFLPMPFGPWGTMGAFINMKGQTKNRKHLFDIGITGPLAGLVVSIVVLFIGLKLSRLDTLPLVVPPGSAYQQEGNSLLYLFMKFLVFGKLLPQPAQYWMSLFLHWVRYFFTGTPLPLGGIDVMISPVAWAGWAGLLVTSLNLIPAGQLDGGHIFFVLFGRKTAQKLRPVILIVLVLLGVVWFGWWLWALLIFFLGRFYDDPLDQITTLDRKRVILGYVALAILFITFSPVPLSLISG